MNGAADGWRNLDGRHWFGRRFLFRARRHRDAHRRAARKMNGGSERATSESA
jgi:hypothetical protein